MKDMNFKQPEDAFFLEEEHIILNLQVFYLTAGNIIIQESLKAML